MSQNPYQPTRTYGGSVADTGVDARTTFLKKTYLHLLGALLAFVGIEALILNVFDAQLAGIVGMMTGGLGGYAWLVVLGAFMAVSWVADRWAHSSTSREMQYLGLGLYVFAQAIIFIPLMYIASKFGGGNDVIWSAGIVTGIIFGGLTLIVLVTKADFSFLRWALVITSVVAVGAIIASIVMGFSLGIWFTAAMIVFASGMILYNTSNVLHHYNTEQYVAASLALFASVALMLWYVIQLFMSFDD